MLERQNSFIAIIEYLVCDKNRKHLQCMSSVNKLRSQVSKCLKLIYHEPRAREKHLHTSCKLH